MTIRRTLPNRRASDIACFEHEGRRFRATYGYHSDGSLGEIFLDSGKPDAAVQILADDAAVLASLLLQHGVAPAAVRHSIAGPVAIALDLWMRGAA